MKRLLCISALAAGLFAAALPESPAQAQTLIIGRGGVRYNAYGQGYYGGYGQGYYGYGRRYNGYFPSNYGYSGYGNGPYVYGSGSARMFPSNRSYGYTNRTYNGYSWGGSYPAYVPVYNPYGFGVYNSYGYGW